MLWKSNKDDLHHALSRISKDPESQFIFRYYSSYISIVDNKISSLMNFHAIFSAVYVVMITSNLEKPPIVRVLLFGGIAITLISTFFLILASWIRKLTVEYMEPKKGAELYQSILDRRISMYKKSYRLCFLSVFILSTITIIYAFEMNSAQSLSEMAQSATGWWQKISF